MSAWGVTIEHKTIKRIKRYLPLFFLYQNKVELAPRYFNHLGLKILDSRSWLRNFKNFKCMIINDQKSLKLTPQ